MFKKKSIRTDTFIAAITHFPHQPRKIFRVEPSGSRTPVWEAVVLED
jgi:hypothetical protein